MKVILSFNLPEEQERLDDALNGQMWRASMQQLDESLKRRMDSDSLEYGEAGGLEAARLLIYDVLGDRNLELW